MENQIKHVAARLKVIFISFWLLPVLLIIVGETGGEWVGMYAADVRATYLAETLVILPEALHLYSFWSKIRIILLMLPVLAGFAVYYLMLSNKGILCAFIALTASLFCLPGEGRLRKELHINKEEEA